MTNGIRPARLRIHIRSSTARASATVRYMATRSASASPTEAASGLVAASPLRSVTVIASSVDRSATGAAGLAPARS